MTEEAERYAKKFKLGEHRVDPGVSCPWCGAETTEHPHQVYVCICGGTFQVVGRAPDN